MKNKILQVQQALNENIILQPQNIANIITNEEGGHNPVRSKIKEEEDKNDKTDQNLNLEIYKQNENKIIHIQSNIRGYNARKEIEDKKNKKKEGQTKNNPDPKRDYPANENELGNGGNNRYFETDKELNVSSIFFKNKFFFLGFFQSLKNILKRKKKKFFILNFFFNNIYSL